MKNILEYYYNIKINNVHNKNNNYYFTLNNDIYIFKKYYGLEETLLKLNQNNYLNKTIINKFNRLITTINNDNYILVNIKYKNNLSLSNISSLSKLNTYNLDELERNNWEILWSNKIDYYERLTEENIKKYPLISESFNYFIGMGEIAISYLVNTKREEIKTPLDNKVISHNSLKDSLYDPSNIILDHKARDIAEYIKYSFFTNNINIFNELEEYFKYNYYSKYGFRILYARIIYPSFYFNIYDNIINNKIEEKYLNKIINKIDNYENYLYNIYLFLKRYYDIPLPEYLKKTTSSLH